LNGCLGIKRLKLCIAINRFEKFDEI